MKSKKLSFFLHFIIFSYIITLLTSEKTPSHSYSPNYSFLNFSNIFLKNNFFSLSIWTKEYFFSNISTIISEYSYFITTSKTGAISIISNNKTLFSIDFNKKMYTTNFNKDNIIKGDNVILPMEGKLFNVKRDYEIENFAEFTTPIKDLVEKTPFFLWFCPDYYFMGNKNTSIVKIINKNEHFDINLDKAIFVDYTLACLKDKEQIWNTTVTNIYFIGENEEITIYNKSLKIDENILIYNNNEELDLFMKNIIGNDYNELLYIHGYNKKINNYVKIFDFNTYTHIIQNNTNNNTLEEKNINNIWNTEYDIINAFDYSGKIIYQYRIDLILYYFFVILILIWSIMFITNNYVCKFFLTFLTKIKNLSSKKSKDRKDYLEASNFENKISHEEIFAKVKNYFHPNLKHRDSIRHIRVSIQKELKSIKINEHSNSTHDLKSELNKDFSLVPSAKSIIKRNSKILKELGISREKQISEFKPQSRLEKDFKEIIPLKKSVFRNSIDVILKAKHKIDEQIYAIKIKKLTNPNEEQSIIAEAQNMKKIRSKHIVEYITCWLDSSVGNLNYLFNNKKAREPKGENNDDIFFSSRSNSKIGEKDKFKTLISNDDIKNDYYIKQLYTKDYLSDDECTTNKKDKINIDNKFYQKKETINENIIDTPKKFKKKEKNIYIDDSLIKNKKSDTQKDISDLSIYFFIQMEFCQEMTLSRYIKDHSSNKMNNKVIYTFTYQLIKSLAKIHAKNIIHANINPENIFVINEDSIKIGDFSSAKDIELKFKKGKNKYNKIPHSQSYQNLMELTDNKEIETDYREESLYSSPEQKKGKGVSKKSDIYSVGLVLYEMCECFPDDDKRNRKIKYLKKYKTFDDKFQKEYGIQCNLILQMIDDDEDQRPSCEELLDSKYMQNWKFSINEN